MDIKEGFFHIKAHGYRPFSFEVSDEKRVLKLEPIKVKALYLTFWGASNNSQTLKNLLQTIKKTQANAVVVDVKNEYGSTSFLTSFKQANSYGAHKNRTNRNIQKFIQTMKDNNIYTIARIVTFKDEIQASNNPEYAIRRDDNGTIWRNHDNMAWVDPFDQRSHLYTLRIAQEAAKVGFDEINFDYIRFPAKSGLKYSKENTKENRIEAIESFLDSAKKQLCKYGVFISVNSYGNILWGPKDDDNNIGQTLESLALHSDYVAPMLYPSGFASGSFHYEYPADYPYAVIYRSLNNIKDRVDITRVRPWLQYFRDYKKKRRPYRKYEIQEQIRPTNELNTNGWMMWSPSSKYHIEYILTP
ncbi:MAG: putative glycoside hydrolase [Sulfurimonas sp.]|nr:putative glycoside hydrolase [Sulfurimonas sp.]